MKNWKRNLRTLFKFSNNDINKFILLLWKSVYPYDYMNDWERFNEIALPEKERFYNNLNMEDITDVDYAHATRVCRLWNKNLGEYHDLYLKSDVLLLADVFEKFKKMCLQIYKIYFSFRFGLASSFKKDGSRVRPIERCQFAFKGWKGILGVEYVIQSTNT